MNLRTFGDKCLLRIDDANECTIGVDLPLPSEGHTFESCRVRHIVEWCRMGADLPKID